MTQAFAPLHDDTTLLGMYSSLLNVSGTSVPAGFSTQTPLLHLTVASIPPLGVNGGASSSREPFLTLPVVNHTFSPGDSVHPSW